MNKEQLELALNYANSMTPEMYGKLSLTGMLTGLKLIQVNNNDIKHDDISLEDDEIDLFVDEAWDIFNDDLRENYEVYKANGWIK